MNAFAQLASQDVQYIHNLIRDNHPGMVDSHNPTFPTTLENALSDFKSNLLKVKCLDSYNYAIKIFVTKFQDNHLGYVMNYSPLSTEFPNFIAKYYSKAFYVSKVGPEYKETLQNGDRILSVDGIDVAEYFKQTILNYHVIEALEATWTLRAFYFLRGPFNEFNPKPTMITVENDRGKRDVPLIFSNKDIYYLKALHSEMIKQQGISIQGKENSAWLTLGSFSLSGKQVDEMKEVIASVDKYSDKDFIVFDLRGNLGGSEYWGKCIIENLAGKDWLSYASYCREKDEYVEWRVSPGVLKDKLIGDRDYCQNNGLLEEVVRLEDMISKYEKAIDAGLDLVSLDEASVQPSVDVPEPLYKGTILVLIDHLCGSSVLDICDILSYFPRVKFIGKTTTADSVYIDTFVKELPSKLGIVAIPAKVYRGRNRGNNEPVVPDIEYKGDIVDTLALKKWVEELMKEKKN